jgi:hypothetical protein
MRSCCLIAPEFEQITTKPFRNRYRKKKELNEFRRLKENST